MRSAAGSLERIALLSALAVAPAAGALACEVPDEGDMPWRRAVAKVKYLPRTEAWSELMSRDRNVVQYVVSLDEPRHVGARCYWRVDVRAGGKLWKRFLVTPQGDTVREDRAPAQK